MTVTSCRTRWSLTQLDEQGIAERYDIVIDFSRYKPGQKVWMVNLCEHQDGKKPATDLSVGSRACRQVRRSLCWEASWNSASCRNPAKPDVSQVPATMIPNPDLSNIPVARQRTFEFGSGVTVRIALLGPSRPTVASA